MDNAFESALDLFVTRLQERVDHHYEVHFPRLAPSKITLERGSKYIRVVTTSDGGLGQRSAFCFIAAQDSNTKALGAVKAGDVLKTASWAAPAKHARGSIFADDFKGYGVGVYGAEYRR